MFLFLVFFLLTVVLILLSIAWYTLLERKFLSYSQWRVGPNKLFFYGIMQPLMDGLKLIFKEYNFFFLSSMTKFYLFPSLLFFVMIFMWSLINSFYSFFFYYNDLLFFFLFLGLSIFFIMLLSLFSNSKFAILGSIRAASQTVSYEISMNFILLIPFTLMMSMNFYSFNFKFISLDLYLFLFWWVSCLMECNRAPFDFAEGESELISGFNLEFSSVGFIFIFLSEYGMMIFFSLLTSMIFFKNLFFFIFLFSIFILIRSSYPRYRYDKMMKMCWKIFLPFSIFFIFISKML